jgi:hypothetical protein
MLVSAPRSSHFDACLRFNVDIVLGERMSLSDDMVGPRRFGAVSITSGRGFMLSSLSACSTSLSHRVEQSGFGGSVVELAPTSIGLLFTDYGYVLATSVGAVLSYTRQPKHVRKNTGGRD